MPKGWVVAHLEDFVDVYDNLRKPINADDRQSRMGPYPYYGATGQVGWIDDFLIDGEYVLLGEDGAPFLDPYKPKAYLVSGKSWVNNHAHVLQTTKDLGDNRYLLYFLNTIDYKSIVGGTTRLKLNQSDMRQMKIKIAPLEEQKRIVEALEEKLTILDETIVTLKKDKEKLKKARASVLKYAVEGKLTETWRANNPDVEPASELLTRILAERRARWEAEQLAKMEANGKTPKDDKWKDGYKEPIEPLIENLPELPETWCWTTVDQIASIQGGIQKQPKRAPKQNAYPYLRVANVLRGRLDLSTVEKMELFGDELETLRLKKGDLLIVEGNGSVTEIGRSALWNEEIVDCIHQNHIIRVRLHNILSEYMNFYWNSPDGRARVKETAASTSGLYTLSIGKISKLPLPLIPLKEQEQVVLEIEQRLSVITQADIAVETNLKRAERARQSLLEQAFSGQLVPQDSNDEPASVLLERIQEERANRTEGKKRSGKKKQSQPYKPQWQTVVNQDHTREQQDITPPAASEDLEELLHAQPVSLWD